MYPIPSLYSSVNYYSEKQGRVYGHLGSCYEMLRQLSQAIFCHSKVIFAN